VRVRVRERLLLNLVAEERDFTMYHPTETKRGRESSWEERDREERRSFRESVNSGHRTECGGCTKDIHESKFTQSFALYLLLLSLSSLSLSVPVLSLSVGLSHHLDVS
jgi:hypothetical protein